MLYLFTFPKCISLPKFNVHINSVIALEGSCLSGSEWWDCGNGRETPISNSSPLAKEWHIGSVDVGAWQLKYARSWARDICEGLYPPTTKLISVFERVGH